MADPDLWGHVQYGRDALAHGLPATTTYSYVAEGYPWINHEILAEYALAIVADSLGGPGLLMIKCLLGVAVIGAIFWRAHSARGRTDRGLLAGAARGDYAGQPLEPAAANCFVCQLRAAAGAAFVLL